MRTFLISYDLLTPGRDYSTLYEHLKSYPAWCRPVRSVWLLKTKDFIAPKEVRDSIAKYVDSNDKIFVINVTDRGAAWKNLDNQVTDWLHTYL